MTFKPIAYIVILLYIVLSLISQTNGKIVYKNVYDDDENAMKLDEDLWQKYRVALIKILKTKFPAMHAGDESNTILSLVTNPISADPEDFLEEFTAYPPAFDTNYSPLRGASIEKLYEDMLVRCNDPERYVRFKKQSINWSYVNMSVQQFVNTYQHGGYRVHFVVDEQTSQTNIQTPWASTTGPILSTGFVKQLSEASDDDEALSTEDVDASDALEALNDDSDRWFWRRRRHPPPPPPAVQTIVVKSSKFKVDFKANGLEGIKIQPTDWFDKAFLRSKRGILADYFGRNGKFPVVPVVAWVAMKPHARIEISQSEWHRYEHISRQANTLGFAIGGTFFRTRNFQKHVRDDDTGRYSEAMKAFYNNEDLSEAHADKIVFKIEKRLVNDDDESSDEILEEKLFDSDDKWFFRRRGRSSPNSRIPPNIDDDSDLKDDALEALNDDSDRWFWRRRRRHVYVPPPPPPPKKVYEDVYVAEFTSTSLVPELIAVTSEIL